MASITIRNLEDDLMHRLRVRAARRGRSIEDEVRHILRRVVSEPGAPKNLGKAIHDRFALIGGVALDLPERAPMRDTSQPD